jgi:choline dehydrogenase-like flavoprotein
MIQEFNPDVIIIGSGVGGGSVAQQLVGSGAKILIIERGDFVPNEPENSDAEAVYSQRRYRTHEEYQDEAGNRYRPSQYYYVGGHTKWYGTAMFRFRERDFSEVSHEDGVSPAWPISYSDLEPWYDAAERLFGVRGQAGIDPTEPPRSAGYAHDAVPHEPLIAEMAERLARQGLLHDGQLIRVEARTIVLSAGAINSALILLRSANEVYPNGIANRSGVVGRYLMNHHLTGLIGLMPLRVNETKFTKTMAINDFYHGLPGDPAARGNIQMLANLKGPMIRSNIPWIPKPIADAVGRHSVDWLCMSEDLPSAESRVRLLPDDRVEVAYHPGGLAAHGRFVSHVRSHLRKIFPVVLRRPSSIKGPVHQCGTVRMGDNPATSALNSLCQSYEHPNLYVVDASFFPSSAALNPALTVCAQALRVGAHLRDAWRQGKLTV